jgi:hypothetical protein
VGQPCHTLDTDTRDSTSERPGRDAVSLAKAVTGGHGTEVGAVLQNVRCANKEQELDSCAPGHGQVHVGPARGQPTTALVAEVTNPRPTFGVGEGARAHQERLPGAYTLPDRDHSSRQANTSLVCEASGTAPRAIPATTERASETSLDLR